MPRVFPQMAQKKKTAILEPTKLANGVGQKLKTKMFFLKSSEKKNSQPILLAGLGGPTVCFYWLFFLFIFFCVLLYPVFKIKKSHRVQLANQYFLLAKFNFFPKMCCQKKNSQPRANGANYGKTLPWGQEALYLIYIPTKYKENRRIQNLPRPPHRTRASRSSCKPCAEPRRERLGIYRESVSSTVRARLATTRFSAVDEALFNRHE